MSTKTLQLLRVAIRPTLDSLKKKYILTFSTLFLPLELMKKLSQSACIGKSEISIFLDDDWLIYKIYFLFFYLINLGRKNEERLD